MCKYNVSSNKLPLLGHFRFQHAPFLVGYNQSKNRLAMVHFKKNIIKHFSGSEYSNDLIIKCMSIRILEYLNIQIFQANMWVYSCLGVCIFQRWSWEKIVIIRIIVRKIENSNRVFENSNIWPFEVNILSLSITIAEQRIFNRKNRRSSFLK